MKFSPILVALLTALAVSVATAADPLRVEVNALEEKPGLISVIVTALDSSGRPLTDLTAANFTATLNGAELPISSIDSPGSGARLSTATVLLVDVSGSMYGEPILEARAALQEFVKNLDSSDQVAVLAFANGVTVLQDFTANRSQIGTGINKLTAFGDTALYDAVIEATRKAADFQAARRLVVILSDGRSTINNGQRDASIEAARASGVGIVSIGLGNEIDREYLRTISDVSGGRVIEATNPASLRQAYIDLAASIRSRYTVHITVPPTTDRTIPAELVLRLSSRAGEATIERSLGPLAGAKVPDFTLALSGLEPNQKVTGSHSLTPRPPDGIRLAKVVYLVDGSVVHVATSEPFDYTVHPETLANGAHVVKAVATDLRGATAQAEVAFSIPGPTPANPLSTLLPVFAIVLVVAGIGGGVYLVIKRRLQADEGNFADNVVRIQPFAAKSRDEMAPPEEWPERPPAPVAPVNQLRGRIVVMDEDAIREGDLTKIREFPIGNAPLTLGAGAACDIQLADEENLAMEEARLWVQKGRLVYHKLTTLSAMATEGVTSGWLLLADGEEIHMGKYRLLFQAEVLASEPDAEADDEPPQPNSQFMGWSV